MDVRDAVASRYSCRAFLPTPVPLASVRDILDRAARAPSGGNLQPWLVHALAGERLEAVRALIRPRFNELPRGEGAEYPVYPAPLKEPYYARRSQVGAALYHALGIPREDKPARYRQYARNFEFFSAPGRCRLFSTCRRTIFCSAAWPLATPTPKRPLTAGGLPARGSNLLLFSTASLIMGPRRLDAWLS